MEKLVIKSVNISEKKGTIKKPVNSIQLNKTGIKGDAHSGNWHRQISLLGIESIDKYSNEINRNIEAGEFAENITTEGFILNKMHPLDKLISSNCILEITQIGKKCHGENCNIFKETGDCVMPKEGVFARVLKEGILKAGEVLEYHPKVIQIKILTLSDRASIGEYEDKSGSLLQQILLAFFSSIGRQCNIQIQIIPDEKELLEKQIRQFINTEVDIIFTTGGTGISSRDITIDTLKPMLKKEISGIMELIRVKYGMLHPNALLSRSIAGTIHNSLIYAIPGNPKAVKEYTDEIVKTIEHSLRMINNIDSH